ncbi:hypothetical protein WR25_12081 [Diploscapter pachys]|uniref:Jumonji domain-containing protein 4 n=1 Tax=Diploscapter pachys TaxID=2018661 RepID=A0A2A2K0D5_9BILA|nr:hypothetical protein WR25_12081 [Diploscapter pachys]
MWELIRIDNPGTPWLRLFCQFGLANQPFVFGSWATADWPARRRWTTEDGKPNVQFLRRQYGGSQISLETSECKYETFRFSDFLDDYENGGQLSKAYLKDWHFQAEFGTEMYSLHPFCSMDWVNCESFSEQPEQSPFNGDYRFVYFGVEDTSTKLHSDVVASFSWSANICGRKQWFMMPPGKEQVFMENGQLVEDIRLHNDKFQQAEVVEFTQNPGEIVFVPTGWHHQVHNLDDSISINHNWMNAANIPLVVEFILKRRIDVQNELEDSKSLFTPEEFQEQIELVLFADARLSIARLRSLLLHIQQTRSQPLATSKCYFCPRHLHDIIQSFSFFKSG